ncbi:response regulator [Spirosoma agri]|uniref:Response regulator n=1 Tax=Spirosoma agri TaxID=1987381 RepID=A0A6M0IMS2_9BACT|nr:response regulator [Spirosoma agri]NEU69558.1 response regulator [Spirosoma agri]
MLTRFAILLVEDDLAIIDIITRTAKTSFPEADFIPVKTFEEAVVYLYNVEGPGPRLALLDIHLGGSQTGLDFLQLMQQHPLGKLVPVVMLSASRSAHDRRDAYNRGAVSFVTKPFSLAEWKVLLSELRSYWYNAVSLPRTWFEKTQQASN